MDSCGLYRGADAGLHNFFYEHLMHPRGTLFWGCLTLSLCYRFAGVYDAEAKLVGALGLFFFVLLTCPASFYLCLLYTSFPVYAFCSMLVRGW